MNDRFLGNCGPIQAFFPVTSLNEIIEIDDVGGTAEVIDDVVVPDARGESGTLPIVRAVAVRAFVMALPERLRDVALRFFWHEQTPSEIAADLKITASAVSHALRRIIKLG